ncbi:hypothetical protein CIG2463D_0939 [Campylobacter iguaniorum]|uniref:tetratricopeptide repeat protein n=1 Tax=Campylobacter iguaniorum TaxID=1244531 RepID=UPI00073A00C3|nr:tetratricopeptide repeat protein [Campylobacter iguaniorum]ALV24512.1 hypothetical protein CIG2463D_0939 [Campylobacter iguaniorum]
MTRKIILIISMLLACVYGDDFDDGVVSYHQGDHDKSEQVFENSCKSGDMRACSSLGYLYVNNKKNPNLAIKYYNLSCLNGDYRACNNLGAIYANDQNTSYDMAKALFVQSCANGINGACANLHTIYTVECNLSNFTSCNELGVLYEYGKGVVKHYVYATKLYQKACDGNDGLGCSNLGAMFYKGFGVEKDINKAKEFFEKGCFLGNEIACKNLQALDRT